MGILVLLTIGMAAFFGLVTIALRRKGNVRAGARLGPSSFFLEATDRQSDSIESSPKE